MSDLALIREGGHRSPQTLKISNFCTFWQFLRCKAILPRYMLSLCVRLSVCHFRPWTVDVITHAKYYDKRFRGFGVLIPLILPLSMGIARRRYNIYALPIILWLGKEGWLPCPSIIGYYCLVWRRPTIEWCPTYGGRSDLSGLARDVEAGVKLSWIPRDLDPVPPAWDPAS